MPTLLQLQSEPWWNQEIVTAETYAFRAKLCAATGRPLSAFGCKGDENHLRGSHRSQNWITNSRFCTSRTYTVQGGLTPTQLNHCAGIDFTPGSGPEMIAQCRRIYAAMRAGQLDEVREFYGNTNGDMIVDGWDNIDDRDTTSHNSHLWHWHLTIDRRQMTNTAFFNRLFNVVLGVNMAISKEDLAAIAEAVKTIRTGMTATSPGFTFAQLLLGAATQAQMNSLGAKVDSLLTQMGALTVAVAEIHNRLDAQPAPVPVLNLEPMQVRGEVRFEAPTP